MTGARKPSPGIEALALYSLLQSAGTRVGVLGDAQDRAAFLTAVAEGLDESLNNQRRLHGRWTQDLFEAVIISLDSIRLIKDEDAGSFYAAKENLRLPDFRVVTKGGDQLLVEVKNVNPKGLFKSQKLRATEVKAARAYAELTGARLVLAHFWAGLNQWSLVDSKVLRQQDRYLLLDLGTAMKENEMGLLGDAWIGMSISSRLRMAFIAAPGTVEQVVEDDKEWSVKFLVGDVKFYCDDQIITDATEKHIAQQFAFFSGLEMHEKPRTTEDGEIEGAEIVWSPPDLGKKATMHAVPLSSIFSIRYILATKAEDGTILRIRHDPDSALARLVPNDYWKKPDRVLKLYMLNVRPASS